MIIISFGFELLQVNAGQKQKRGFVGPRNEPFRVEGGFTYRTIYEEGTQCNNT